MDAEADAAVDPMASAVAPGVTKMAVEKKDDGLELLDGYRALRKSGRRGFESQMGQKLCASGEAWYNQ